MSVTGSARTDLTGSYRRQFTSEQARSKIDSWKAQHPSVSGHQGRYPMREIVNALLYQGRTGCQRALLPHDFPPPGAVKYYFYTWRNDGTDQTIHDLLCWQVRVRRDVGPPRGTGVARRIQALPAP
jgi:transposase